MNEKLHVMHLEQVKKHLERQIADLQEQVTKLEGMIRVHKKWVVGGGEG